MSSAISPPPVVYPSLPEHMRRGGLRGAIRLFGPGAIIASVTIGSGETFFASRAGAIFGYGLLWFIVASVAAKCVQVYTGARYMVLTGEHPMEAWARLPGPRGWFPACLGVLSVVCFPFWLGALSMMVGTLLNWVSGVDAAGADRQWLYARLFGTVTLVLAVALTLIQTYRVFEKVQTAIVAILLVAILAAVVVSPIDWLEAIRRLFIIELPAYPDWMPVRYPERVAAETEMVSLVMFMAAIGGGTYDYIGYLSCFREKRWGALRRDGGEPAADTTAAPVVDHTDANLTMGRRWLRAPVIDVFAGFACVLVFTLAFNLLGAAILHPERRVPDDVDLLNHQVAFLTQFGAGFKYLYQAGILMAFWGTIYGAFEIYSRTAYECFRPLSARVRATPYERFRLPVCLYAGIGGLVLAWTRPDPMEIIKPIAPIAMITCGLWCFAMIWADRKVLPRRLRITPVWVALNTVAGAAMTGFGVMAMLD